MDSQLKQDDEQTQVIRQGFLLETFKSTSTQSFLPLRRKRFRKVQYEECLRHPINLFGVARDIKA